jgi:hypothetical protein
MDMGPERTLESAESEFRPVGKMGLGREGVLVICHCIVYMLLAIVWMAAAEHAN